MKTRVSVKLKESAKNLKQEPLGNHNQGHYSLRKFVLFVPSQDRCKK